MVDLYVVILAGGEGKRLWPLSTPERPKQFLDLDGSGRSLLQATVSRAERLADRNHIIIVGGAQHSDLFERSVPGCSLLLEPVGRNTAAAIGLAANHIARESPRALMVVLSSDHVIRNEDHWEQSVRIALDYADRNGRLVTIGKWPDKPSSNYGYMVTSKVLESIDGREVYAVDRFVEKPDRAVLEELLQAETCFQNMGMFVFQAEVFLEELERHLPETARVVAEIAGRPGSEDHASLYASLLPVSVDHGVFQQSRQLSVVPSSIERLDVGNLEALRSMYRRDGSGNAVSGIHFGVDSAENLIYSADPVVATVGVDELTVIATDDAVLICPSHLQGEAGKRIRRLIEKGRRSEPLDRLPHS